MSVIYDVSQLRSYETYFPMTENPFAEGGNWTRGLTDGLDWTNPQAATSTAYGTQTNHAFPPYDDSIAHLGGTWKADQRASGIVHAANIGQDNNGEVEILLRFKITAHNARGYEINANTRTVRPYWSIVRWEGAISTFTNLSQGNFVTAMAEGDLMEAQIVGQLITFYRNGAVVTTVNDPNGWTDGAPGMGFFRRDVNATLNLADVAFSHYKAWEL